MHSGDDLPVINDRHAAALLQQNRRAGQVTVASADFRCGSIWAAIVPALAGPGHAGTPAAIGGEPSAASRGEAVVRLLRRLSRPGNWRRVIATPRPPSPWPSGSAWTRSGPRRWPYLPAAPACAPTRDRQSATPPGPSRLIRTTGWSTASAGPAGEQWFCSVAMPRRPWNPAPGGWRSWPASRMPNRRGCVRYGRCSWPHLVITGRHGRSRRPAGWALAPFASTGASSAMPRRFWPGEPGSGSGPMNCTAASVAADRGEARREPAAQDGRPFPDRPGGGRTTGRGPRLPGGVPSPGHYVVPAGNYVLFPM